MIAYLRVLGGFFAATFALMALDMLASGDIAAAAVGAALAIGLGYPTSAGVLRQRRNRVAAEHAALVARAEAGHAAFLAGRLDPLPPPAPTAAPPIRTGVKIAIGIAGALFALMVIGALAGPTPQASERTPTTSDSGTPAAAGTTAWGEDIDSAAAAASVVAAGQARIPT